jgi:hypothetical protein
MIETGRPDSYLTFSFKPLYVLDNQIIPCYWSNPKLVQFYSLKDQAQLAHEEHNQKEDFSLDNFSTEATSGQQENS